MKSTFNKFIAGVLIASFIAFLFVGINGEVQAQDSFPPALEPVLSADGLTLSNGVPPLVIMADPSPAKQNIKPIGPTAADLPARAGSENASFSITYIAAGSYDFYGTLCYAFPDSAKTAFNAAANIWAVKLQSSVPIVIKACWADLSFWPGVLGYSGGQESYRDFTGAPKANTWYESSLANSLHGSDLDSTKADINITYHKDWPWYYGTNGLPPAGTYDLVSVAAHEIAHGLNFSGTADYSGGIGSVGDGGFPNIYDTFMENGAGTQLISLPNPSTALGDFLTSGDLWFDGPNSYAANANVRVKIFAPASWMGGSSYSHLDYDTFGGTANSLMVYAIGSGSAQHNPGPVTLGLFKDLGWRPAVAPTTPTPVSPSGAISDTTPTYKWTRVANATQYRYQLLKGTTLVYTKAVLSTVCGTSYCASTPSNVLTTGSYKWRVQAFVGGLWKPYSVYKAFSITFTPTPVLPSGLTPDTTPTYKWTKILGASQYRYTLMKGTTLVYTKTVPLTVCGTTYCTSTPSTVLSAGSYTWRVQAYAGGAWKAYSAYKAFSIAAPSNKPKAGLWRGMGGAVTFYVLSTQNYVDDFTVRISVTGCGDLTVKHDSPLVPIANNHFSFSGSYWANGTFNTTTTVTGQVGFSSFYIPGCGYLSGTLPYTAAWYSAGQPLVATLATGLPLDVVTPAEKNGNGFWIIEKDAPAP